MTNAELALLSLVVEGPCHGYDIERMIVDRNMRDWTDIGFSSIYYVLDKLEKAALVTSTRLPAPGRGPARRVYTATETGIAEWQRESLAALAGPARRPTVFQLGLSALPALDKAELAEALASHENDLEGQLDLLAERSTRDLPFNVSAVFDLAITQTEAELEWIRRFAAELRRRRKGTTHDAEAIPGF